MLSNKALVPDLTLLVDSDVLLYIAYIFQNFVLILTQMSSKAEGTSQSETSQLTVMFEVTLVLQNIM